MAEELTRGRVAPLPVRWKSGKLPCSYCDFRLLCGNLGGRICREMGSGKEKKEGEEEA